MGEKSRGNFRIGYCMRTDCQNRTDDVCAICYRFSEYRAPQDEPNDEDEQ